MTTTFVRIRTKSGRTALASVGPFDKPTAANWLENFDQNQRTLRETRIMVDMAPSAEGNVLPPSTLPRIAMARALSTFN